MRTLALTGTLALLGSSLGCGLIDRVRGGDSDETGGDEVEPADPSTPSVTNTLDGDEPVAANQTPPPATGLDRFKHWAPPHAMLSSPTIVGDVIGKQDLIVATLDAHVGVSKDGGTSWQWTRADELVRDVTGYPGGPYVVLHEGALALSSDGQGWTRTPRYLGDSLIDVAAAEIGLIAIGKNGGFVHLGKDGSLEADGVFPNKFKPKAVTELNGAVLAWAGKNGYGTTDGSTWTELEVMPPMPDGRTFLTSAGSCTIAKVGTKRGVACSVAGTAHGIGEEFVVENKGTVSLTRDGGETWLTTTLPFKGANAIFGVAGGPYYAIGNAGAIAISKDGQVWVDQKWEEEANLLDGLVDGDKVIIVGAKGTLIYSTNGGAKWEYATPPVGKNLTWIGSASGQFVATDGRSFIASQNGVDWVETAAIEFDGGVGDCGDNGPEDRARCRWNASVSSPEELPEIRGLVFDGDAGLGLGDAGLVAVTADGGASWKAQHGLGFGKWGATGFAVRGDKLLVTNATQLFSSADAGATWVVGATARTHVIRSVHLASNGIAYAAAKDELLAAKIDPQVWLPVANEPMKGDWQRIFEVDGVIYVSASKGQLIRSEDGDTWTPIVTGSVSPVIAMAGDGEQVWAATAYSRYGNNLLLRSEDNGAHFILVGETPSAADEADLRGKDGAVYWADVVSRDHGETWRREIERYFPGLVDVQDGSGMQIANDVYRYGRDKLYVVTGPGERDWVRIDSAYNEGGRIQCDPTSGCWMLASGVLYRPLGG